MCFNIGINRMKKFVRMWDALKAKDYQAASDEMLQSLWRSQVGKRAVALAAIMRGDKP
jgi:GH24 family phage-related lysozyme (muramidase)